MVTAVEPWPSIHANQKSKEQQELCVLVVLLLTSEEAMLHLGHPSQQMALRDGQHQASLWPSDPDTEEQSLALYKHHKSRDADSSCRNLKGTEMLL